MSPLGALGSREGHGPLSGVTVLDLSGYVAGPYGCALLGDLGALVIKIEPPEGDNLRNYPSTLPGESRAFLGVNRNKRGLGFIGKSCIHPTQVPLANAVFRPTDTEIRAALRIVEAARGAETKGVGAFVVDGRMIDIPFIKRAESILGAARRLGLAG